jgi:hypothetical protein
MASKSIRKNGTRSYESLTFNSLFLNFARFCQKESLLGEHMAAQQTEDSAVVDALTLHAELCDLAETSELETPNSLLILVLNWDAAKSVDQFWRSNIPISCLTMVFNDDDSESDESFDLSFDSDDASVRTEDDAKSDAESPGPSEQAVSSNTIKLSCSCKPKACHRGSESKIRELFTQFRSLTKREKQCVVAGVVSTWNTSKHACKSRKRQGDQTQIITQCPKFMLLGHAVCRQLLYQLFVERRIRNIRGLQKTTKFDLLSERNQQIHFSLQQTKQCFRCSCSL